MSLSHEEEFEMLAFGIICALVATASAAFSSSSAGSGAGLYNSNTYAGQTYGSSYPYSNQYTGYTSTGGNAFPFYQPFQPLPPFASPLYNQQLAHQAAIFNSIKNQAYGGGGYGGGYGGGSAYGGAGAYTGGAATGSYGGIGSRGAFGGTYGGDDSYAPNYASAGGYVGNGYKQQYANVYPANPSYPNLDSRFGGDDSPGVSVSRGPGGFVGVSSFSSSSDVNGQKFRQAATTVNDNGKVTTYRVQS